MKSIIAIRCSPKWMLMALGALAAGLGARQASFAELYEAPSVALASTASVQATAQTDGANAREPLPILLPKPKFAGTPRDIRVPNLEPFSFKDRLPFMAPKGCVNLALRKPVIASDENCIVGELHQITDGIKEGDDGNWVELGPGRQWIQIDLMASKRLYAVMFWQFALQMRVYHDVVVQVSDDRDFADGVTTLFNNDYDNSLGFGIGKDKEYIDCYQGKLVSAKGVVARYVRLYSNGSDVGETNHYIEVEVYGVPLGRSISVNDKQTANTTRATSSSGESRADADPISLFPGISPGKTAPLNIKLPRPIAH
ncbi:MAG: hypothetical protein NTX50_27635 [Candidatus Sumerlaeota bacterium]|nr:hypothetical protein [Candidatus Sumerlaeota bacterium]